MKKHCIAFLIFALFNKSNFLAQEQLNYVFDRINNQKGLPFKGVGKIKQAPNGMLWMITDKGLSRYNGHDGKSYPQTKDSSGLLPFPIANIFIDKAGFIWLGYMDACVSKFDPKTEKFTHYYYSETDSTTFSYGIASDFLEDKKGNFWIAVWGGGLVKMDRQSGKFKRFLPIEGDSTSINTDNITSLTENIEGKLVIGCWEGGKYGRNSSLQYFDPNTGIFKKFPYHEYKFIDEKDMGVVKGAFRIVHFIYEDEKTDYWIGTFVGLFHVDNRNKTIRRYSGVKDKKLNQFGLGNYENTAGYVRYGNQLWVYTEVVGILVVDMPTGKCSYLNHQFENKNSISSDNIRSLFKDEDENIWVTSSAASIDIYSSIVQQFKLITNNKLKAEKANRSQGATTVSHVHFGKDDGKIYLSHGGGYTVYNPVNDSIELVDVSEIYEKNKVKYKLYPGSRASVVLSITEIDDKFFFLLGGHVLIRDKKTNAISFLNHEYLYGSISQSKFNNEIYSIGSVPNSKKYFKNPIGIYVYKIKPNSYEIEDTIRVPAWPYSTGGGYEAKNIQALDAENWLVDLNKYVFYIYNTKSKKFKQYSARKGLENFPDSALSVLTVDNRSNVWFRGQEGVYKFNHKTEKTTFYNDSLGILNEAVLSLTIDKNNMYWFALRTDIIKYNPKTGEKFRYSQKLGLNIGGFAPVVTENCNLNEIYIAGAYGVVRFDSEKLKFSKKRSTVFLSSLIINKDTMNESETENFTLGNTKLNWDENFITFAFASSQYYTPGPKKYTYRLSGMDSVWYNNENRNFVSFTNLAPGTYTFEVFCENVYGIWSYPLKVPFVIKKPFWKTWWFIAVVILIAIFCIYKYIVYRETKLNRAKELLELKVNERTSEVVEKAKEIENQNTIIQEKNKELTDSIKYAERIQKTLLANKEFMEQHLPEHFVLFKPKDIVSGDFYWATSVGGNQSSIGDLSQETESVSLSFVKNELFYLAICDSTGHGVPGAFMSLLNISFLNEAIGEKQMTTPNSILNYVRQKLIQDLSSDGAQDGMDGTLLCYNRDKNEMTYASAHNKPVVISAGKMLELPADKMPIGKGERTESFNLYKIEAKKGDTIYFYTDGFADQFGGPKGKKFKYKQLNELLVNISSLPLAEQHKKLNDDFDNWRGRLEQVDDVLLIGIKV